MTTTPADSTLPDLVRRFRDKTRLKVTAIAKLADLSPSTVSLVVNDKTGRTFEAETEEKLRRAMRDYVYDVSGLANEIIDDDPEVAKYLTNLSRRRDR